jgi:hypothetical protein
MILSERYAQKIYRILMDDLGALESSLSGLAENINSNQSACTWNFCDKNKNSLMFCFPEIKVDYFSNNNDILVKVKSANEKLALLKYPVISFNKNLDLIESCTFPIFKI